MEFWCTRLAIIFFVFLTDFSVLPIRAVIKLPQVYEVTEQHWLYIEADKLIISLEILKLSHLFKASTLLDIWCVDYPHMQNRHALHYNLLSPSLNKRFFLETVISQPICISVTNLYSSAGWLEREVWDMHGINFIGHSDLRRILTDYGFVGFPLRKDFPLGGFTEIRYVEEMQACVYEPITVSQEFRLFDYASPWLKNAKN